MLLPLLPGFGGFFFLECIVGLKLGNSAAEVVVNSEKDVNNDLACKIVEFQNMPIPSE